MVSRANLSIFHQFFSLFADINEPPYFCLCSDSLKFLLTLCILFVLSYLWRFIDPHSIAQKCTNMHILTKCFLFLYFPKSPENKIRQLERFLTTMLEKGNDWRNITHENASIQARVSSSSVTMLSSISSPGFNFSDFERCFFIGALGCRLAEVVNLWES